MERQILQIFRILGGGRYPGRKLERGGLSSQDVRTKRDSLCVTWEREKSKGGGRKSACLSWGPWTSLICNKHVSAVPKDRLLLQGAWGSGPPIAGVVIGCGGPPPGEFRDLTPPGDVCEYRDLTCSPQGGGPWWLASFPDFPLQLTF